MAGRTRAPHKPECRCRYCGMKRRNEATSEIYNRMFGPDQKLWRDKVSRKNRLAQQITASLKKVKFL